MSRFELLDIDHLVITTPRVEQMRQMFVSKMKFRPCPFVSDEILRGKCRLSIQYSSTNDRALEENAEEEFGQEATPTESVTDVAFSVRNLDEILRRVCASDSGLIHHGAHYVGAHPRIGAHRRAVIKSVVGNVVHTLIEVDHDRVKLSEEISSTTCQDAVSTLDHIALACRVGESSEILQWYEDVFQMRAFDFGEGGEGLKIETDDLGMRLKALEYWRCSEKGLFPSLAKKEFPLLVIAEPLPGIDARNQIDVFLSEHGGPGIQHLGLNTTDICRSKEEMSSKGVDFIVPPHLYYQGFGKLDDIIKAGEDPARLQQHGILIDYEDFDGKNVPGFGSGYLMQVFTKPLFEKDTFFLELIERRGARGFGAGNITALFKAVQAYMKGES